MFSAAQDAAAFRRELAADLRSGRRGPRTGVRMCHCGREWDCHDCGKPFRCWDTWPVLWKMVTGRQSRIRICIGCYTDRLREKFR